MTLPTFSLVPSASVRVLAFVMAASVAAAGGTTALAQQRPAPAQTAVAIDNAAWLYEGSDIPPDRGWQFGTLSNGLRYAVRRNGVPPGQVTIRLRVGAGSLMETPEQAGWAHLIEHLTFRESRYLTSGEARRAWQRLGVSFGSDTNASTGATSTIYQLDIPAATASSFADAMRLLSGMIREPVLTDATVNAERPIVIAERRERDGPAFRIETATREHLFAGQLLGQRSTIGTEATLNAANGAGVRAFHQAWYRPSNIVIAIAGDLDPALLEQAIARNFGDWRVAGAAPSEPDFGQPDPTQPVARVIVEPSQPAVISMFNLRPWRRVTDSVAYTQGLMLDSLTELIINRQLEERARRGGRYLQAFVSGDKPSRSVDMTSLTVVPLEQSQWQVAVDDVRAQLATAMAAPPTEAQIMREFAEIETYLNRELANAQNEPGTKQADDLLNAVDIGETVTSPDHALDIWRSIRPLATPAEIARRMQAMFTGTAQRVLMTSPVEIAGGAAALEAHVTRPIGAVNAGAAQARILTFDDLPALGAPGRLLSRAPVPQFGMDRIELANGVTALVRNIPIEPNKVRITVRWGRGRQSIAPANAGLLWSGDDALVQSGIRGFDQTALEQLVSGRQIGMSFEIDEDAFELSAETTPADLADQLHLLAAKLVAPGWDETPVLRARAGRLATFDGVRNSPMAVIESSLESAIFAGDQRFGAPSREAVSALTPQAFRTFWSPLLAQGPIEVQIFGDLAGVNVDQMLLANFGAIPRRQPLVPPAGAADVRLTPPPASPMVLRHGGSAEQAAVVLVYPTGGGIEGASTSRVLEVLAAIFNDRLYDRLRDQAGASYSQAVTSSWSNNFASGSYIFVGGLVRPDDSELMATTARSIANDLMTAPVTADELQRAVGPIVEQITRSSSGNVFWMMQTEGATRDPRRFAILRSYLRDLEAVTPDQLQMLARTYLSPQRAVPVLILPDNAPVPRVSAMTDPLPALPPRAAAPQANGAAPTR